MLLQGEAWDQTGKRLRPFAVPVSMMMKVIKMIKMIHRPCQQDDQDGD